jgi:GntR family transcriptional regulator, trigonelline degradation regulator
MKVDSREIPRGNAGRSKNIRAGAGPVRKSARESAHKSGKGSARDRRPSSHLIREILSRELCALITDGTFKPGDHMTERELCDRLKVSRPSIRETLRQLEAEGLVDIYPNRGAVVRELTRDTFVQLWEVRQALETLAAERFARSGRPEQIERFDDAIRRMDAALRSKDRKKIKIAKSEMFEAFVAGANSELLSDYVRQINVRLSFLWSSSLLVEGRGDESISELLALRSAVRAGNPDAARAAVLLYNEHSKAMAMHALRVLEEQKEA